MELNSKSYIKRKTEGSETPLLTRAEGLQNGLDHEQGEVEQREHGVFVIRVHEQCDVQHHEQHSPHQDDRLRKHQRSEWTT